MHITQLWWIPLIGVLILLLVGVWQFLVTNPVTTKRRTRFYVYLIILGAIVLFGLALFGHGWFVRHTNRVVHGLRTRCHPRLMGPVGCGATSIQVATVAKTADKHAAACASAPPPKPKKKRVKWVAVEEDATAADDASAASSSASDDEVAPAPTTRRRRRAASDLTPDTQMYMTRPALDDELVPAAAVVNPATGAVQPAPRAVARSTAPAAR